MTDEVVARAGPITVLIGDLTAQDVDAVVNAANERLAHGGGVAAAIARAAGPRLQADSDAWVDQHGPVGPGTAVVTAGHLLPARQVVHVVGPRHRDGQDNEGLLTEAVRAALDAASGAGARTVALPAISAGVFGYPPAEAAAVIAKAVRAWLADREDAVDEVRLVAVDATMAGHFAGALGAA